MRMTKTPEDESEHLPPDDEEEEDEEETEKAHDDCTEEPAGPPAPSGIEEPKD